jgi:glycolate oxidase
MAPNYYLVDGVVPRTKLQEVMARVSEIGKQFKLPIANVFHAGDGNLHPCILFDERQPGDIDRVVEAGARILEICVEAGGALSGEHGIGLEKQSYMGLVFNHADLEAMAKLRPAFGAGLTFNPDKIFPGSSQDAHGVHRTSIRSTGSGDVV